MYPLGDQLVDTINSHSPPSLLGCLFGSNLSHITRFPGSDEIPSASLTRVSAHQYLPDG